MPSLPSSSLRVFHLSSFTHRFLLVVPLHLHAQIPSTHPGLARPSTLHSPDYTCLLTTAAMSTPSHLDHLTSFQDVSARTSPSRSPGPSLPSNPTMADMLADKDILSKYPLEDM